MVSQSEELKQLREQNQELKAAIERLSESGLSPKTVAALEGKYVVTSDFVFAKNTNNLKVGEQVLTHPGTGQIVEKIKFPKFGDVYTITSSKDGVTTISHQDKIKIVVNPFPDLKCGDKVLMDPTVTVVTHIIESVKVAKPSSVSSIKWEDIGGHVEAKALIREFIEMPYKFPKLYQSYNKKQPKGILLWGPPGCGKTLLGKATATALGNEGGFLSVKGPEILNMYVGESERKIRDIFEAARAFKEATGKPAVIFIDEAESLLSTRSSHHNYMGMTIVPTFLTCMDGIEDTSAIVMLSTNRPDTLDPAIIRDGRIDHKVEIKRPDAVEAKNIFDIHLNGTPVQVERDVLITAAVQRLYQCPAVPHSGALIAGIVDKAITAALRRDCATNRLSGVCQADMTWAIDQVIKQGA
jgi:proteasome-associated ATPase